MGTIARRCPYCGERIAGNRARRRAAFLLAATALTAIGWGWARIGSGTPPTGTAMAGVLADRRATVCLALAVMLLAMPAVRRPALPGAATRDAAGQTLGDAAPALAFGLGLFLAAGLLGWPAARLPASLALLALAPFPRLLRRPAYPLLAVPLVLLAWRLAAS
ncbi:MAG: hypothetical protein GX571_12980 [Lentisphaerae bacterium]|nr:hypothetical protein [Lentisphaerota bacterium]